MNSKFNKLYEELRKEFSIRDIEGVSSVGVYGSFARGEPIENWSDMDVMVFINSNNISKKVLDELKDINQKLSSNFESINLVFRVHSLDEFPNYFQYESSICSYSLFSFYKEMKFIYGNNMRGEMRKVLKKLSISEAIKDLRSKLISSRHESRSIYTSSNEFQPFTQSFHVNVTTDEPLNYKTGKFIDMILECAMCCNFLKGYYNGNKKNIALKFKEFFPDFKHSDLPMIAYKIRQQWNSPQIEMSFFYNAAEFFEEIIGLFDSNLKWNQVNNSFEGLLINDSGTPYRGNACGIIINDLGKVLIVKKDEDVSWQFPQGGVNEGEEIKEALLRELNEELGLTDEDIFEVIMARHINQFDWPPRLQEKKSFRGQAQRFFLVRVKSEMIIKLQLEELSEFKWVNVFDVASFVTREDLIESFNFIKEEFPDVLK